jgi:hypothetical protein
MTDRFSAKIKLKFNCEKCNFICSKKNEWDRHIGTLKHKNGIKYLQKAPKAPQDYTCHYCFKVYKHRQSLFTHCRKCHNLNDEPKEPVNNSLETNNIIIPLSGEEPSCSFVDPTNKSTDLLSENITSEKVALLPNEISSVNLSTNDMMMKLIEQNMELQKQIVELAKQTNVVNNTNNITNNTMTNHFNLNLFLNDTCKDALNIDDFMNSLQLSIADLEKTGHLGFVEGITRIFLQGLKDLDITQRPFHCTDIKRETVYIKDQNKWEKETDEKKLMKQALNQAVRKNLGLLHAWQKEHPDYLRSNTKDNDDYIKISLSSLGSAYDDEQKRMDDKIIRNVLKEIILDKKNCNEGLDEGF